MHGDIKPPNICLGRGEYAGRVYLIDFGFAWRWTSDSPPSGSRGTVPYSSLRSLAGEGTWSFSTPMRRSTTNSVFAAEMPRDDLESLAYTMARLLTGTLPWAFQSDKERLDGGAGTGKDIFPKGYPDVFAQLVDFARSLAPTDDLQYERWRDAFRGLEPGLPECPMFDQHDRSGHRLWVSWVPPSSREQVFLPDVGADGYIFDDYKDIFGGSESRSDIGGDHGFDAKWPSQWLLLPFGLEPCYTIGDEFDVVSGHLDFIDEPPVYNGGRSVEDWCPPEVMNNTQSSTRCIRT